MLFHLFSAAVTSEILMQSADPSLTSANILWSHSFSSFFSYSTYSFHESLILFSFTATLPDALFIHFDLVISCLSLTICFAIRKISFWHSESHLSRYDTGKRLACNKNRVQVIAIGAECSASRHFWSLLHTASVRLMMLSVTTLHKLFAPMCY